MADADTLRRLAQIASVYSAAASSSSSPQA
jgi:hypothetical protein